MTPDVLWLFRLTLDQRLITRAQAATVRAVLGDRAELMDVAQRLIDDGVVEDVATLEKIAGLAMAKGAKGPPLDDPFDPAQAPAPTRPASLAARPSSAAPPAPSWTSPPAASAAAASYDSPGSSYGSSAGPAPARAAGPVPTFPFATLAQLDDAALAAALRDLLRATARHGASDLHLSAGARPFLRKDRALAFLAPQPLPAADALRLNTALLSAGQKKTFLERRDYDYALAAGRNERYRVNLMFHKNGAAGAYRMVPDRVRPLAELGFAQHDATLKKLLSYHNGLILITGPVGSGKTTTLASMVDYLNTTRTDHLITVEDPIEVVQPAKGCNVSQREVGPHTKSFATALKAALREDPDVIVIGELRDLETIEMAITASETGHLVIGTMHTSDAATTLNRLLDVFPPSQQTQIRASVAESLRGIVCQRLLPADDGGLTLACEILVSNVAIQSLIREGKTVGLRNTMETGVRDGMCLMDNVVFGLYQAREISAETALANITNRLLRAKVS